MSATIDPSLPLERDVRRLLAAEIEGAIEALGAVRVAPSSSIHAARKRFKKLRALLKLVRSGDEEFYARENARYRDLSRSLAPAREATALVETVDRFIAEYPRETGVLAGLRARLAERMPQAGDPRLEWVIAKAVSTAEAGGAAAARFAAVSRPKDASQMLERGIE
ncbi:MAG: CHAD domain-containing protein, partial [Rhizobiaceae bacterium]